MIRIGIGYDVHRFEAGRRLVLGGIEIPFSDDGIGTGLLGHSDADVAVHAVMDALLGAAALGDIGTHFPPSDPTYKDSDSCKLLGVVVDLLCQHNWVVGNIDTVIIAEKPRLCGFIPAMREKIAGVCGIDVSCVSVKATTEEGLGLNGQGIGAKAVCTIFYKES